MVKYLSFHNSSSFALRLIFNVNGKAKVCHVSFWTWIASGHQLNKYHFPSDFFLLLFNGKMAL
jgi:hypothetical protein